MVESATLERWYRGNSIEGSNPSLSVYPRRLLTPAFFMDDRSDVCTVILAPDPGDRGLSSFGLGLECALHCELQGMPAIVVVAAQLVAEAAS